MEDSNNDHPWEFPVLRARGLDVGDLHVQSVHLSLPHREAALVFDDPSVAEEPRWRVSFADVRSASTVVIGLDRSDMLDTGDVFFDSDRYSLVGEGLLVVLAASRPSIDEAVVATPFDDVRQQSGILLGGTGQHGSESCERRGSPDRRNEPSSRLVGYNVAGAWTCDAWANLGLGIDDLRVLTIDVWLAPFVVDLGLSGDSHEPSTQWHVTFEGVDQASFDLPAMSARSSGMPIWFSIAGPDVERPDTYALHGSRTPGEHVLIRASAASVRQRSPAVGPARPPRRTNRVVAADWSRSTMRR